MKNTRKLKKGSKKNLLLITVAGSILVFNTFVLLNFLKQPVISFPKAANYDITGNWQITANITQPMSVTQSMTANFVQEATGKVSGTFTGTDGVTKTASGQVNGNQVSTAPTSDSGKTMGISYEATYSLNGTINDANTLITGSIQGNVITPIQKALSGTFTAQRQGAPPTPTPTITPTPTPIPTPTPTPTTNPSPTPTRTPTPTPTPANTTTPTPTAARTTSPSPTVPPVQTDANPVPSATVYTQVAPTPWETPWNQPLIMPTAQTNTIWETIISDVNQAILRFFASFGSTR